MDISASSAFSRVNDDGSEPISMTIAWCATLRHPCHERHPPEMGLMDGWVDPDGWIEAVARG